MTEQEQLTRAARARELLENPLLAEALDKWETEITEAWKKSNANAQADRESMFLMLKASHNFKTYLQTVLDGGKLIEARSVYAPTMWDKAKRWA